MIRLIDEPTQFDTLDRWRAFLREMKSLERSEEVENAIEAANRRIKELEGN